jgi:small basic protein (TIGR04137 family)
MSLHRSLKTKPAALNQHRNVLTRAERIMRLQAALQFDENDSPLGLAKVGNRQVVTKKKKKEEEEKVEGEATVEETPAT